MLLPRSRLSAKRAVNDLEMKDHGASSSNLDENNSLAVKIILGVSAAVVAFLFWFIYGRGTSVYENAAPGWAVNLPAVNASLNALSATFVVAGLVFIKRGLKKQHAAMMITATVSSVAFLVTYLIYHYYAHSTPFAGEGWIRPVYFFILLSHIVLSVVVVPLIGTTLFFATARRFLSHKKVAKWTYPVWLYVSATGILVYAILNAYNA